MAKTTGKNPLIKRVDELQERVTLLEQEVAGFTSGKADRYGRAAEQPAVIAKSAQTPAKERNIEENLGLKWLGYAGILSFIFGIFFLVTTPQDDLFGYGGRIGVGILASILLILLGFFFTKRQGYLVYSRILIGGGFASLYYAVFAAHHFPHYARLGISWPVDTAVLSVVVVAMILAALRLDSATILSESYLLGFLTAAMTKDPTLFTLLYGVILTASILVILTKKRWDWIALPAVILTETIFLIWYFRMHIAWMASILGFARHSPFTLPGPPGMYYASLAFQAIFLFLFLGFRVKNPFRVVVQSLGAAWVYVTIAFLLSGWNTWDQNGGWVTALFGILFIILYFTKKESHHLIIAITFFAIAIAAQATEKTVSFAWIGYFLCLTVIAIITKDATVRFLSFLLGILTTAKLASLDAFLLSQPSNFFSLSLRAPSYLAGAIALLFSAYLFATAKDPSSFWREKAVTTYAACAIGLLSLLIVWEYHDQTITLLWTVLAILTIVAGFLAGRRAIRIIGLTLLGIVFLKAYLYDIFKVESATRTVMFILLGILLLIGSFVYARFKQEIKKAVA